MFIFPFIFKVGNFSEAENNKSLNLHKKATHWSIVGVVVKFYLCYLASGLLNFLLLITDFSSDLFLTCFTSQNRLCRNMNIYEYIVASYIFSATMVFIYLKFWSFVIFKQIVQEYERAVIFRLGRLLPGGAKGPGIIFQAYDNFLRFTKYNY